MSAALSPDGSKGVLIDLGERLYTFDVGTGVMKDTGWKGAWPVRYSSDGRHVAMRSSNSGRQEQLRIVEVAGELKVTDVGQFGHVGYIRQTNEGGFRATAEKRSSIGIHWQPKTAELNEVWKSTEGPTDFDIDQMLGITTNYRLVTKLIDLRTGAVLLTVDNSANARLEMISTSYSITGHEGNMASWIAMILFGVPLLVGVVVVVVRGTRRTA
jgi:hypothetical protein